MGTVLTRTPLPTTCPCADKLPCYIHSTDQSLEGIPTRPACTCPEGRNDCQACDWWLRQGGRAQLTRLGFVADVRETPTGDHSKREAAPQKQEEKNTRHYISSNRMKTNDGERQPPEEIWIATRAWLATHGELPQRSAWNPEVPVQQRPDISLYWIRQCYRTMRAFYAACVERGIATSEQEHRALARAGRRDRRIPSLARLCQSERQAYGMTNWARE